MQRKGEKKLFVFNSRGETAAISNIRLFPRIVTTLSEKSQVVGIHWPNPPPFKYIPVVYRVILVSQFTLPDFLGGRIIHLLNSFTRQVITVLVAYEIKYFQRLIIIGPFTILDH